jgi:hypothetical protein
MTAIYWRRLANPAIDNQTAPAQIADAHEQLVDALRGHGERDQNGDANESEPSESPANRS